MQWEWIIPVVVLAFWILNSLIRGNEEKPGKEEQRPGLRKEKPMSQRPQRPKTDMDRFLEEMNRLRQRAAEERGETTPSSAPEPSRPAPRRQPAAKPARRPVSPPVVRPVPQEIGFPIAEEILEVEAVVYVETARPVPKQERRAQRTERFPAAEVVAATSALPAFAQDRETRPKPVSAPSALALLRHPESLQQAVILQEILGPPRCRRRER